MKIILWTIAYLFISLLTAILFGKFAKLGAPERRRFNRKQVRLPVFIGKVRLKTEELVSGIILDISIGGIRFTIPKRANLEIPPDSETTEFAISFTLPGNLLPINVKCRLKRVIKTAEDVQIGAAFVDTAFSSHQVLQQCLQ